MWVLEGIFYVGAFRGLALLYERRQTDILSYNSYGHEYRRRNEAGA